MTISLTQLRDTALNILSRREHSKHELKQKLYKKYPEEQAHIEALLEQLETENMQSDHRFAASFLRNRLIKRHGKNRIIREMKQKGIPQESIDYAFQSEPEIDWFELAKELKLAKFGSNIATDYKEKAKQLRYLQYRGFNFDEMNYAIQCNDEE